MRFQFLTSYYPPFLKVFFSENDCSKLNYNQTLELLLNQFFADTGALEFHTKKAGYSTFLIIANCEVLQKKWAHENNIKYSEKWMLEIAFEQIKQFKPDVFYLEYVLEFFGSFVTTVKPFCRKIVSWISSPLLPNTNLKNIDLVFSSTPDFVDTFKKNGSNAIYMHPAFDVRVLSKLPNNTTKSIDFSFVGGWSNVHVKRKVALKKLAQKTPLQLWGYNYIDNSKKINLSLFKKIVDRQQASIIKKYNGEAWGLKMYSIIQQSLITFNIHEELLKGYVGNMRMFEATGMGTLILNDNGYNLSELFEIGKEIEVYNSIDEAIEKTNYYINNPQKAIEIGMNAQQKTIKNYNYDIYVGTLVNHLKL